MSAASTSAMRRSGPGGTGEVLEAFVSKRRDHGAALKFFAQCDEAFRRTKDHRDGRVEVLRRSTRELGLYGRQEIGRWRNNRAENSHQPLRRRERAMQRFRRRRTLERFASVRSSVFNQFNKDRHLNYRDVFKAHRAAALDEWRQLGAT